MSSVKKLGSTLNPLFLIAITIFITFGTTTAKAAGTSIRVSAGGDFQAALNQGQPGDEIVLEAGATFTGPFYLPNKAGTGDIIIRSSASSRLRDGVRVSPASAARMPKLVASGGYVVATDAGAHNYRFIGVEFKPTSGTFLNNVILMDSAATGRWTDLSQLPHDIVIDRCYIHGDPKVGSRRGIAMNAANVQVLNSYISDFKEAGADSQAISTWNGTGPFRIQNNYLEAAAENLVIGGADPTIANLVPSDIHILGNSFYKPLSWKADDRSFQGTHWMVKSHLVLKNARRVVVDGNTFQNNWTDIQDAFSILLTVRNQGGTAPWSAVQDVLFTHNTMRNVANGINVQGWDNLNVSQQAKRLTIKNNLFYNLGNSWGKGIAFQMLDGSADVHVEHNTILESGAVLWAGSGSPAGTHTGEKHTGFVLQNNVFTNGAYGITGDGALGPLALTTFFSSPVIQNNAIIAGVAAMYPANNFYPASINDVKFVNFRHGNFELLPRSPYKRKATDGTDIGANFAPTGTKGRSSSRSSDGISAITRASSVSGTPATIPMSGGSSIGTAGTGVGGPTDAVSYMDRRAANSTSVVGLETNGSLNGPRQAHTATLLNNGAVLIAGGLDDQANPLASAELYNAGNRTFAVTGNMAVTHVSHTATLLNNGRVLIAGGYDGNYYSLANAELYNPATGTFVPTGSLNTPRNAHTATLLNDGTILIAGGSDTDGYSLSSAELYNPSTGTFTTINSLNIARSGHTATLLNNGKVLLAGGYDSEYNALDSAELYDPTSGTFTATGSMTTTRVSHTATILNNGTVLLAGGQDTFYEVLASADVYDPASGTFTATGSLNDMRYAHSATLLNDGTVLVIGGTSSLYFGYIYSSAELYDPTAQTFTYTEDMGSGRESHAATRLKDGMVLTTGGRGADFNVTASAELYEPATQSPPGLLSIVVNPQSLSLSVGSTQRLTATGTFSGSSTQILSSVTWNSSNGTVATVTDDPSNRGHVFALSAGSATVTACAGSVCGSASLSVLPSGHAITGLSPASGSTGTPVTISGTNFGTTQGASTITFSGTSAAVSSWSDSSIVATVPAGATAGNVIVTISGVPSNGVYFTIPGIAGVFPTSGPIGARITVAGVGFGATQGTGSVKIGNTPMQVLTWTDTQIMAVVANGTITGTVSVQQGSTAISGPTFTITAAFPYKPSPQSLSMLVGDSRTVSVTDIIGHPVTGLSWMTTNSGVVSLSSDDPPGITAITPGLATVYAGVAPVTVTVYAGTSLPVGTAIWSLPLATDPDNFKNLVAPAVESTSDTDVFVVNGSGLSAVNRNGTIAWQASIPRDAYTQVIPDFSGSVLVKTPSIYSDAQGFHSTHTIQSVNPATGQRTTLYTFAGRATSDTCSSGTCYSDSPNVPGSQVVIPDTTGALFVQDIPTPDHAVACSPISPCSATVTVSDLSTGQTLASIPLENSTWADDPSSSTGSAPPAYGKMIVAGDGNAYLPYAYSISTTTSTPENPPVTHSVNHLNVLRVSPDGTYSKIQLNQGTSDTSAIGFSNQSCSGTGMFFDGFETNSAITNVDTGVAVFAHIHPWNSNGIGGCGDPNRVLQVSYVSQNSITLQTTLDDPALYHFSPALQREDGSYLGTDGSHDLIALTPSGDLLWQQSIGSTTLTPLYATSDGGLIVTSTQQGSGQFGSLYTVDQDGNVTLQSTDTGALPSWDGRWYGTSTTTFSAIALPAIPLASTYAAVSAGNPSGNLTSVPFIEFIEGHGVWGWFSKLFSSGPCKLGTDKVALTGAALEKYTDLKQKLLTEGNLTGQSCETFFNDGPRAGYFSQLVDGVTRQVPFDSQKTTISFYDAGMLSNRQLQLPSIVASAKKLAVCKALQDRSGLVIIAAAQPQPPATDIYINPDAIDRLTQGTLLHETLHQLTGLPDHLRKARNGVQPPDLKTFVDIPSTPGPTNDITKKLVEKGCAK